MHLIHVITLKHAITYCQQECEYQSPGLVLAGSSPLWEDVESKEDDNRAQLAVKAYMILTISVVAAISEHVEGMCVSHV